MELSGTRHLLATRQASRRRRPSCRQLGPIVRSLDPQPDVNLGGVSFWKLEYRAHVPAVETRRSNTSDKTRLVPSATSACQSMSTSASPSSLTSSLARDNTAASRPPALAIVAQKAAVGLPRRSWDVNSRQNSSRNVCPNLSRTVAEGMEPNGLRTFDG